MKSTPDPRILSLPPPWELWTPLIKAAPSLLEPLLAFDITVPEEFGSRILGDLVQMRGEFENPSIRDGAFRSLRAGPRRGLHGIPYPPWHPFGRNRPHDYPFRRVSGVPPGKRGLPSQGGSKSSGYGKIYSFCSGSPGIAPGVGLFPLLGWQ